MFLFVILYLVEFAPPPPLFPKPSRSMALPPFLSPPLSVHGLCAHFFFRVLSLFY